MHFETVGQIREALAHAVEQLAGERQLRGVAEQIGPAQRSHEQEVARQHHLGHARRPRAVEHEERQVLGGVPRRVARDEPRGAELEGIAVV
jgi:hypothetical protein